MKHEQGQRWTEQPGGAQAPEASTAEVPAQGEQETETGTPGKLKRTRTSVAWAAVLVALVLLVFLLVFILQNLEATTVDFLGFSGSLPLALAMLFSAIAGAALVALLGVARMIQLRRAHRKANR